MNCPVAALTAQDLGFDTTNDWGTGVNRATWLTNGGGGWSGTAITLRSAYRGRDVPDGTYEFVGFRCALAVDAPIRLWNRWELLLAFAAALTLEWLWRRQSRLV